MKTIHQHDPGDVERVWSQVDQSNLADVIGFTVAKSLGSLEHINLCVDAGYAVFKRRARAAFDAQNLGDQVSDRVLLAAFEWLKRCRVIMGAEADRTGKEPNLVLGGPTQ